MASMIGDIARPPEALARRLQAALRATVFESRLTVTPRRLAQLADAVAAGFGAHTAGGEGAARAMGRSLAGEGLGHSGVLALVEALHTAAAADGQPLAAIGYGTALLCGYMEAREEHLLREQERTRLALERARAAGRG